MTVLRLVRYYKLTCHPIVCVCVWIRGLYLKLIVNGFKLHPHPHSLLLGVRCSSTIERLFWSVRRPIC